MLVRRVEPDSAAATAGIAAGDVITALVGEGTPDRATLTELFAGHDPGDRVEVEVLHPDGAQQTDDVTLGELHSDIQFVARHMTISKTRGRFRSFSGTIEIAEVPEQSGVVATIEASSVTATCARPASSTSSSFPS